MTALTRSATDRLRTEFGGELIWPADGRYEDARQVWNASHDYRPALVAQPLSVADVRAAVAFAGERGLPVCVRGGGHNHAGYGVADGALMLDLSAMVSVRVDPARRVATVGGGTIWSVLDRATQAAGLAVTGADVSPVGVGGSTLGGGVGWLHRMFGLSCDNLLAAEIVTADARMLSVSAAEVRPSRPGRVRAARAAPVRAPRPRSAAGGEGNWRGAGPAVFSRP